MLAAVNLSCKAALLALLAYGAIRSDLPQFAGKAPDTRLFTYGLAAVILPAVWLILRPDRPYPHAIDICIVAPFLLDTAGNALDLYDQIGWWDDLMHYLTWIPWVTAFGLLIVTYAPPIPPWAVFGVVLGFGASTHLRARDVLGDLFLSLMGSVTGALIVSAVAASRSRSAT